MFGAGVAAALVAVLVLAFSAGVASERDRARPHVARRQGVLLVGDSIFHDARAQLTGSLSKRGWRPTVRAVPATTIRGGGFYPVDWQRDFTAQIGLLQPAVVVAELGTNGCGTPCPSTAAAIDRNMRALRRVRIVVWLDVREAAPIPPNPNEINDALEAAQLRWPNLRILDINRWFHDHPELIGPDNVHPTETGDLALALFVADALDRYHV